MYNNCKKSVNKEKIWLVWSWSRQNFTPFRLTNYVKYGIIKYTNKAMEDGLALSVNTD